MAFNSQGIALLWHDQEKCSPNVAERALRTETPEPVRVQGNDRSPRRVDKPTAGAGTSYLGLFSVDGNTPGAEVERKATAPRRAA
jgi:hypothetical protein